MDSYSLIDYQNLMKKITNGDLSIQEPINIHNKRLDTLLKISFLSHLLNYDNIDKDNILNILFKIYIIFQNTINFLKKNDTIQVMLERINNEWYEPDNLNIIDLPLTNNYFDMNKYVQSKYLKSYEVCDEIDHLCKVDTNLPFNDDQLSHPLEPHLKTSIYTCEETIKELKENIEKTESILEYLKKFDLHLFIDLSIKHKSLYLKLNDKEDDDIPENIHIIFSNFIHIHNLLYKQMIHYHKHILSVLEIVENNCMKLNDMKQNIERIAYMRESQVKDIEDDFYKNNLIDSDSDDLDIDESDDELVLVGGTIKSVKKRIKEESFF